VQLQIPAPDAKLDVHGNQVALLERSRCYQSSAKLSCTTCHDVHAPERPAAAYSGRCLGCHKAENCGVYPKLGQDIAKNCVDCHMPVQDSDVIVSIVAGKPVKMPIRSHWIKIYRTSFETLLLPTGFWTREIKRNAAVEVASEEKAYPIESALLPHENEPYGWRAANPGTQVIRLIFDEPQTLRRIWLVFEDTENTRTQEFVLQWSPGAGRSFREIVRQQWNFSPPNSMREIEDYTVDLCGVAILEVSIVPDKSEREAWASLATRPAADRTRFFRDLYFFVRGMA
jgi:hypothetical protein